MKKICSLFLMLVMVMSFAVTVSAADMPRLVDEAGILSASEASSLTSKLDTISNALGYDVAVVTKSTLDGTDAESAAYQIYRENGYASDGVLLLINMGDRDWVITAVGAGDKALNKDAKAYISKSIVGDLGNGNYAKAFTSYADICEDVITDAKNGKTYKKPFAAGKNFIIAFVISLIVAFIATSSMKGELTSVRSKADAKAYIKQNSLKITQSRDRFLYTKTDKVQKQQNTSPNTRAAGGVNHSSSSGKF